MSSVRRAAQHTPALLCRPDLPLVFPTQDVGLVSYGFRLMEKLVDLNALFTLSAPVMHLMPDFKQQLAALRSRSRR